jgi:hypothetical protein
MKFQELYNEMTQSTEIIRAMLHGINQVDAQIKKSPRVWSILEVTCHLYDEEREDFRKRLQFILGDQEGTWPPITPFQWVITRKYNEQNLNKMKTKFFKEREASLAWLKTLRNTDWTIRYEYKRGMYRSAGELFASWVAHDNLHIRQITELRRRLIEQKTKPYKIGYAGDW